MSKINQKLEELEKVLIETNNDMKSTISRKHLKLVFAQGVVVGAILGTLISGILILLRLL